MKEALYFRKLEMKKTLMLLASLFFLTASAFGQMCRDVAMEHNPYQGMVGAITKVSSQRLFEENALVYDNGVRYDFIYVVPGKRPQKGSITLSRHSKKQVREGDAIAWIPLPKGFQKMGKKSLYDPTIFSGEKCQPIQDFFSVRASEIPL